MEEEKSSAAHTIALALTEREAALLNAALRHYWLHLKSKHELHAALPTIEALQREIVDQSRAPVLHPTSVAGIKHLIVLNRLIFSAQERPPANKEEQYERRQAGIDARYWLNQYNIPIHPDSKMGIYRFGTVVGGVDAE